MQGRPNPTWRPSSSGRDRGARPAAVETRGTQQCGSATGRHNHRVPHNKAAAVNQTTRPHNNNEPQHPKETVDDDVEPDWPMNTGLIRSWARDGYQTGAHTQAYATARAKGVHTPVAVMPDAHVGQGACIGTVVATQGTIIPSCVGVDLGCFVGDTSVPLLNGTERTLKELAETGGIHWVFSIDADGGVVPGKAVALRTRQNAALVKLALTGGSMILCTPDHEFMLRDGTYRQAHALKPDDTLMGLHRSRQERRETVHRPGPAGWTVHSTSRTVETVAALDETADVYCLQVEEHHNFALSAGVFVHNCGMSAAKLNVASHQLPDSLEELLPLFGKHVPAVNHNDPHSSRLRNLDKMLGPAPSGRADMATAGRQTGTLGSGNHFLEVSLDTDGNVWVVVHSGSRGVGNKLAQAHIRIAERLDTEAPKDLAAFTSNTAEFDAYVSDMRWAQAYAFHNREEILKTAITVFGKHIGAENGVRVLDEVKCHHNYATEETHGGKEMWITRKGAIRAREGDRGIIPGSMGTSTFIVRGLGNAGSYQSAAHGAGRVMSRNQAKACLSLDDLHLQMEGRVWLKDRAAKLLDEAPDAYKDIHDVMAWQADLCAVETELVAILNYKGA